MIVNLKLQQRGQLVHMRSSQIKASEAKTELFKRQLSDEKLFLSSSSDEQLKFCGMHFTTAEGV